MTKDIYTITTSKPTITTVKMLDATTQCFNRVEVNVKDKDIDLTEKNLVIAVDLDELGYNLEIIDFITKKYSADKMCFRGSSAIMIVNSPNELYTKSFAQDLILRLNNMGCRFPGHPLIENIVDSKNFKTWQLHLEMGLFDIALEMCKRQGERYLDYILNENFFQENNLKKKKKILALHASSRSTSNTLALWHKVKSNLDTETMDIQEFNVENGTIVDCKGCEFITCMHYSKKNSCFYGGVITKELLPAIEESDIIIWICPNYNDAISAKLMAVINRLTVLYRRHIPYDKRVYGIIVSGNSGSDSIAKQLIGALNINKGFQLPRNFMISTIANNPGDINTVEDIDNIAELFAKNIC